MSEMEPRELIRKHFDEMYNRGNLDFAERFCAPGFMMHDPVRPDTVHGPDGLKEYVRWAREGASDLHFDVETVIVEGDHAAARFRFSGTQDGPILGIPATGRFATMTGQSFYRLHEGRVAEVWVHWDVIGLLRGMGVQLPGVAAEPAHH
jgi:steroid delta-isomerase-like uncharacterized protein